MPEPLRLLLIEDNPCDVRLIQDALDQSDIKCDLHAFTEGAQGLEFIFANRGGQPSPVDIVLLDLHLPDMDGADVLRQIKSDERTRSIPVIVYSSSADQSDIETAYNLHANCFISKPVGFGSTREIIHTIQAFWTQVAVLPR